MSDINAKIVPAEGEHRLRAPPKVVLEPGRVCGHIAPMRNAVVEFRQLRPILGAIAGDGIDVGPVLAQRGLGSDLAAIDDRAPLSIVDYFRLQRDIALAADDLTAHFSQRKLTFRTGHFVVSQLQQAGTLVDAMTSLVDHFNMMHGDAYNSVRRSGAKVSLIVNDSAFPYTFSGDQALIHFIGDCLLIKVHCLLDSLSQGLAERALRRVRLQRDRDAPGSLQNAFWSAPIEHGWPTYELVYDHELACLRFPVSNRIELTTDGLFNRVIEHLESRLPSAAPSIVEQTRALIDDGHMLQDEVARHLGMSVATHRRRLEAAGESFRDLVKQSRLRQAEAMLMRGLSVAQVTDALDYSDIRAFNRAFKAWMGMTPAAFARAQTSAEP